MAVKVAGTAANQTLHDNGTVSLNIGFVDSVGAPTTPVAGATVVTTAVASDPSITITGVDPTGLIVSGLPTLPPVLPFAQGVFITATTNVTNPDGTVLGPFTTKGDPINLAGGAIAGTVEMSEATT